MDYDPREPLLSIGMASKKLGVSPEALRLYEKEGLLVTHKTETGRRLYSQNDMEWIECFRDQILNNKMNIAGIRLLLALMPCWDLKPCTKSEQENCPAYKNSQIVCWMTKEHQCDACKGINCRDCLVYREACQAGKLDKMYVVIEKNRLKIR